ncbi:hypothetical protein DFP73DRAFT_196523 [Morchella snyderi]|nr:hypothetical protein DFP73DRAFT_196523 [Morchella snyderi]
MMAKAAVGIACALIVHVLCTAPLGGRAGSGWVGRWVCFYRQHAWLYISAMGSYVARCVFSFFPQLGLSILASHSSQLRAPPPVCCVACGCGFSSGGCFCAVCAGSCAVTRKARAWCFIVADGVGCCLCVFFGVGFFWVFTAVSAPEWGGGGVFRCRCWPQVFQAYMYVASLLCEI